MKPAKPIESLILTLRNQKVILNADLAELYGVPTKRLNEAVKRNSERFPEDFLFRLTVAEKEQVVANCDHLARLKFSPQFPPHPPSTAPVGISPVLKCWMELN